MIDEVEKLVANPPEFPDRVDRTDIEFVTIDPASSMDLDQAVYLERAGEGYRVYYAIADVASFVEPGGAIDAEAHRRGQTFYAPGARLPLHPRQISEDLASLLDDGKPRPAYLWELTLDGQGHLIDTQLTKAMVLNRKKLDYDEVQRAIEDGSAVESLALLREIGELREAIERERGGISLNLPDQEIDVDDRNGEWDLVFRDLAPSEDWNAQISLLTGIAAAKEMLEGKVGVLRTLPPAEDWAIARLRRQARSLGVEWPKSMSYPEFVRSLDPSDPKQQAVLVKCTFLFRGASYLSFDGQDPDEHHDHSALATPYAHTTAPLRRLVDRYVLETCWALLNDSEVPQWVSDALPELPEEMDDSTRLANRYERGVIDLAEALVLKDCVGREFEAALIDVHPKTKVGTYQIAEPAVEVRIPEADQDALGELFTLKVTAVDLVEGQVELSVVAPVE